MKRPRGSHHENLDRLPRGVHAASLTPQRGDLSVDHETLAGHCRWLLENGCDGVALFGTTGEAPSFTIGERMESLETVVRAGVPPERLLVGTGCCAIPDTVTLTKHATELGVGGVLVLPPFFFKDMRDEGVYGAYDQIIQHVADDKLRLFLYHYPQMSGVPLSISVVTRLAERYPRVIVGIKDSSGDWECTRTMCESFPDFDVYPGTEIFLLDAIRAGGAGCISATVNVTGRLAGQIFARWKNEDMSGSQADLNAVRKAFEAYPLIAGLKHMMGRYTGRSDWRFMRPPLSPLGSDEAEDLERALEGLGFTID